MSRSGGSSSLSMEEDLSPGVVEVEDTMSMIEVSYVLVLRLVGSSNPSSLRRRLLLTIVWDAKVRLTK